jgi:hypothetical protein
VIPWPQLIADLHSAGLCNCEIARRLNVSETAVRHWIRGSEPRYSRGTALIELHKYFDDSNNLSTQTPETGIQSQEI